MTGTRLLACIQSGHIPHAILITGPAGSGRSALGRRAAALFCRGEDAPEKLAACPYYGELAGASVGVAQVRELMGAAATTGFNGGNRAFLVTDAHRMGAQSQNALLKTLEEPPKDTLLLLTGSEAGLLPTVRSRCMLERLGASPLDAVRDGLIAAGTAPEEAALCARLSDGVPGRAAYLASEEGRTFRRTGLDLFGDALFREPPFAGVGELIKGAGVEGEAAGKKGRADPEKALRLLELWESMARDGLLLRLGVKEIFNADRGEQAGKLAFSFTEERIQSIIETLETAQRRVYQKANPQLTLDAVIAQLLPLKESTWQK